MKLLNHTSYYFSLFLLLIMTVWSVIFYFVMLSEIYDSMDDGLENQKMLVLNAIEKDSTILQHDDFENQYYLFNQIEKSRALMQKEIYFDTLIYMQNENEYEPVRALKSSLRFKDNYYEMLVITSMVEEDDLIASLIYSIIGLYLGLVGTILLTNNLLLKKIWSPFYSIVESLKNFRIDQSYKLKTPKTSIDEFRVLNKTVEKLIEKNIRIYNTQKQFIENASHELQTPLAITLNKLEHLAANKDLNDEHLQIVSTIIDNLQRLVSLNRSLLLLAKIENEQFSIGENVDLNNLIRKVTAEFSDLISYKKVNIQLIEENKISIHSNSNLLQILFMNLIKNAVIHNKEGGAVKIIINDGSVKIINTGDKPLNQNKIYNRFYKEDPSASSTGLGLAISKSIADYLDLTFSYSYDHQHIFIIKF